MSGVLKILTPEFTTTTFDIVFEEQRIHDTDLLYASNEEGVIYMLALGDDKDVDTLWREYLTAMGDEV